MTYIWIAYDHPQGNGEIIKRNCNVHFDLYLPIAWARFRFAMLVCRGSHTHHPPYPEKFSEDLANEVITSIRDNFVLSLTTRKYFYNNIY
jgi:hypothetical protein